MTDDESRNAAWYEWLYSDACITPYDRNAWNAAWAEAMKRERERYMKLFSDALQDHDWSTNVSVRELLAMVMESLPQEPKP